MKYLTILLTTLFILGGCTNVYAYDSVEEIDNLKQKDFLQQLLPKKCRSSFEDNVPRTFENLNMLSYKRKNCDGKGIIDSLSECNDVDFTCTKPSQEDMDGFFEAFKTKEKNKLAKRQARQAFKDEQKALKEKLKTGDLKLDEINKLLRE